MSTVATKLFEEREQRLLPAADNAAVLKAVTAETLSAEAQAALNDNAAYEDAVESLLFALDEDGKFGTLERYVFEEAVLYGKSQADIAAELAAHAEELVHDLLSAALRTARRPEHVRALKDSIA